MWETFSLAIGQISILFIFLALGYVFKKKNILPDSASSVISKLEVYVFLPALCFNTFADNFHLPVLREKSAFIGVSVVVLAATFLLAKFLSKRFSKNPMTQDVYLYALTIPNIGYLGYPLIAGVYGEEMLLNFMIFALPYNLFIYTAGKYILTADKTFNAKSLLEPALLGIYAGIAVGILDLKVPSLISSTLSMASACMAPLAMVMTGFVLARTAFKFNISNPKMYLASFLRLILIPCAVGGILLLLGARGEIVLVSVTLLCMPMGLNNVVFPEAYGGDSATGAQSCFVSHALGALTIPLLFAVLSLVV